VLPASIKADHTFWNGVNTEPAEDLLHTGGILVYPAYVEHEPRFLLKALAAGCTVIATSACGLFPQQGLVLVPYGDYEALKAEVLKLLPVALAAAPCTTGD
jgi:glycosyltransferase involved in cell wall biosynthesis